jgi:chromosome segregation ATPase
VLAAQLAAA